MDEKYVITFIIYSLPNELANFEFKNIFPNDMEYTFSMFFSKQNAIDVLRKISTNINRNEVEFKDSSKGNFEIDIINKVKEDAKKLRYDMQINNQEVYKVYIFLKIRNNNLEKLYEDARKIKTSIESKMASINTLNFRHLMGYLSTLPLGINSSNKLPNYFLNMTTENLKTIFPFYTSTLIEEDGILFGKIKSTNEICVIDFFNKNHFNSNMCIFGSSGSGKSYFTKLIILRNYLKEIKQYIIDQEGEYIHMPGEVFDILKDKLNILEFFKEDITDNYFERKLDRVSKYICDISCLNEYKDILKEKIKEEYYLNNISEDINSLYKMDKFSVDKHLKEAIDFPTILDVIDNIKVSKEIKKKARDDIVKKLKIFCDNFSFLCGVTSKNLDDDIVIFDISKLKENKEEICEFILEYIIEKISKNTKSLIYIDEIWRLIRKSERLSSYVFDLYKTVRKKNAGIITITQDISDFFSLENSNFGKSIFNNSFIKVFFKLEYQDFELLKSVGIINDEEYMNINKLNKGQMNMYFNNACMNVIIKANECELKYIEGSDEK